MNPDRPSPDPDGIAEPPPVDQTAELVSAWLDDELSPDERARLDADPGARTERDRLESVAALVAAPVDPPPAELVDLHVQAALDASSTTDVVVGLDRVRAQRRWWTRPATVLAGAVAAGVLVLAGFLVTVDDSDDGGDTTAADVDSTAGAEEAAEADQAEAVPESDDALLESGADRAPQPSEEAAETGDGSTTPGPAIEEAETAEGGEVTGDPGDAAAGSPGEFATADEAIDTVLMVADETGIDVFTPTADLERLEGALGVPVPPLPERPVDCVAAAPELYDPATVALDVTVATTPAQVAFTRAAGTTSQLALVYDLTDCSLLLERPVES